MTDPSVRRRLHRTPGRSSATDRQWWAWSASALLHSVLGVRRSVEPTVPPQVTYALTDLGAGLAGLAGPLCAPIGWFGQHTGELLAAQAQHDTQHEVRRDVQRA